MVKKSNIDYLKSLRPSKVKKPQYRAMADDIIDLYINGDIPNIKTAINLISKLDSTKPASTVAKVNLFLDAKKLLSSPSNLDAGLEDEYKAVAAPVVKPRLVSSYVSKPKKAIVEKLIRYFVSGEAHFTTRYERTSRQKITRQMHTVIDEHKSHQTYSKNIYASSSDNAKLQFKDLMRHEIEDPEQYRMIRTLDDVQFKQVISETSLTATHSKNILMKRANVMNYSFICEDRTK